MNPTTRLHEAGQSIWLDTITRDLLDSGTLQRYVDDLSLTGLTSNPTIFDRAIEEGTSYDAAILELLETGHDGERLFFELALDDLRRAADVFRPVHERTGGTDGWVSLEVSPRLAHDTEATVAQARQLHEAAGRPNLYVKIPGTVEGLPAIEDAVAAGIAVNVTLLFSTDHYLAAAEAYMRGLEWRLASGEDLTEVSSVASLFVSRWDAAIADSVPDALLNRLGIAVARHAYAAYRELLASSRWQQLAREGARPQRLLFASTGTKDPDAPDTLYVAALAAPDTIDTVPEATLLAFADHGVVGDLLPFDPSAAEEALAAFVDAGVDIDALAARLQAEGEEAFNRSWSDLLACIRDKSAVLSAPR
ncbi:MAG TPA: transaldolase [Gaiellaceae bacterium]|nr:transaldolase [Gaiellaceae bacterium]